MPLKRKDSDRQDISSVKGKGRDDLLSGLYVKSFHIYHQFKHHRGSEKSSDFLRSKL